MNVALRKGNRNASLVETQLYLFLQIEEQVPIVLDPYPRAKGEIDTAIPHLHETNRRRGILEDSRFRIQNVLQDLLHLANIVAVADARYEVQAARPFSGLIFNHTSSRYGIGDDLGAIVQSDHRRSENSNILDRSLRSPCHDIVAHLVGLEDDNQYARSEIRERALQGEADGQARRPDHGNEGCGRNPNFPHRRYHDECYQSRMGDRGNKSDQRRLDLTLLQTAPQPIGQKLGHPVTDNQNSDCEENSRPKENRLLVKRLPYRFEVYLRGRFRFIFHENQWV